MAREETAVTVLARINSSACAVCGIPLDSQVFDASGIFDAQQGRRVLARVDLPPRYCGVLEYFSQFTDENAQTPAQIETIGLEWSILMNGRPLNPYLSFTSILNPWGYGSFQTSIRLVDGAALEFVVRQTATRGTLTKIGGRLVGRYWYNTEYGDVVRPR